MSEQPPLAVNALAALALANGGTLDIPPLPECEFQVKFEVNEKQQVVRIKLARILPLTAEDCAEITSPEPAQEYVSN